MSFGLTEIEKVELAKVVLKRFFKDLRGMQEQGFRFKWDADKIPVADILQGTKTGGLKKSHFKQARREMGIKSANIDGVYYWDIPEEFRYVKKNDGKAD